jgi:uncharacterized protein (DUF488 family)
MKTSNFKRYKGNKGVAICLYPPLDYSGGHLPSLAPEKKTFFAKKSDQIDEKEYEKQYREGVLSKLDPKELYDHLRGQVLLCWEEPGDFCHRRILADWIQEKIGIEVPEWQPGDDEPDNSAKPLF